MGMLETCRVVELSGRDGWMAGFLLAQLGAEVILVEPPGGHPRDAWFDAYNCGKRSVVASGAEEVAALAAGADIVLAAGTTDEVAFLDDLAAVDPTLVTVAITPFGRHGPKADWLATDLTLVAASGQMAVTGDPDRPPVRTTLPQAWMHGCCEAVVGALVALTERARSGLGQQVDCSVQSSVFGASLPSTFNPPVGLPTVKRSGGGVFIGTLQVRWVYPAVDGHVVVSLLFGPMGGPFTRRLIEWMHEEGCCREETLKRDYVEFALKIQSGEYTLAEFA
jgi:crotonobetainyl-CoA:carnitine CoA-transferase CaiB-like acyl-CoA transferase